MVEELAAPGAEIAEKGPDFTRRIGEAHGTRNRPDPAAVEVADDDLLIGELDKDGRGSRVVVAKATPSLPSCAGFPVVQLGRRPAGSNRVVVGPLGMVPGAES
jgi:hypothetical protein